MAHPLRPVEIGAFSARLEPRADGTALVHPTHDLGAYPDKMTDRLAHWAQVAPARTFLAERGKNGEWRELSYADAYRQARAIATALLVRGLSAERPVVILSGNSVDHALVALGAMVAGVAYAPISPPYSLVDKDFGKLKAIFALLTPGLVFAENATPFANAIRAAASVGVEIAATRGEVAGRSVTSLADLLAHTDDAAVNAAHAGVNGDTIAKFLFTSGSTGLPKGVINTQRMLCANQAQLAAWLPFVRHQPPVLVDWLPWNHTFGGNHNFGLVLDNGGTLYIDAGKPVPTGIAETARNLREISPTIYFNVPKGFEELLPHLRADAGLRENFFKNLQTMFYAGASLAPAVAAELEAISIADCGARTMMVTGLGATETAPSALASTKVATGPGVIGVPLPGVTMKLVPNNGKLEARVKGVNITPGYWRNPEQTAKAFDEEGFYCFGDALRPVDEGNISKGFYFDGRVSEDFKLGTGTWVSVGPMRAKFIAACAPLVRDVVIAGHDRDFVAVLVFPDMAACRALAGAGPEVGDSDVLSSAAVTAAFATHLVSLAVSSTGSSTKVQRAILMAQLPSIEANEITDKGSINQRAVLTCRASLVEDLFGKALPAHVIALDGKKP